MSEGSNSDDSNDEGVEGLFDAARISEKGLAKLATHEVTDKRTQLLLTSEEIGGLKLAIADKARLKNLISSLTPKPAGDSPTKASQSPTDSGNMGNVAPVNQVPSQAQASGSVQVSSSTDQLSSKLPSASGQQFGIAEVAAFLAGRQVPPELNVALNALTPVPSCSEGQFCA